MTWSITGDCWCSINTTTGDTPYSNAPAVCGECICEGG